MVTAEQPPPFTVVGVPQPPPATGLALGAFEVLEAAAPQPLLAPPQLPLPLVSWTKPQPPWPLHRFEPRQV